jgi:hypothetical protein
MYKQKDLGGSGFGFGGIHLDPLEKEELIGVVIILRLSP